MRGSLMIGAALMALLSPGQSQAQYNQGNSAWCLLDSDGAVGCFHYTLEMCLISARGLGGTCYANQDYRPPRQQQAQRSKRRRD